MILFHRLHSFLFLNWLTSPSLISFLFLSSGRNCCSWEVHLWVNGSPERVRSSFLKKCDYCSRLHFSTNWDHHHYLILAQTCLLSGWATVLLLCGSPVLLNGWADCPTSPRHAYIYYASLVPRCSVCSSSLSRRPISPHFLFWIIFIFPHFVVVQSSPSLWHNNYVLNSSY